MDKSLTYRKMCYKANEIQDGWKVEEGDIFVLKTCYCQECNSEDNLGDVCLEMDNSYIIAESHINKYYLFNPHLCVRGDGCRINSTAASILVTDKNLIDDIQHFNTYIDDVFWIPRQEDLQKITLTEEGYSLHGMMWEFSNYIGKRDYKSYEQYWLAFTMDTLYGKEWNGEDWA